MGCWNETCAVSKLPIRAGERVVFLPVAQNPWNFSKLTGINLEKDTDEPPVLFKGSSGCYSTDHWAPIGLPLIAEYNDYGSIENIESSQAEIDQFTNIFKEMCITLDVGENSCHDVSTGKFTLDEVLNLIQEGRAYSIYNEGSCKPTIALGAVMIKKSVWDALLETDLKKDTDRWYFEKTKVTVDTIKDKILKRNEMFRRAKTAYEKMSVNMDFGIRELLGNSFGNSPFSINTDQLLDDTAAKLVAELEFFYIVIGCLRISLTPTIGAGSQDDNRKLWKKINTKFNKIIQHENKLDKENE